MCGISGGCGIEDPASRAIEAHLRLQHRAQEFAGLSVLRGETILTHKGPGLISGVFTEQIIAELNVGAYAFIAHNRYSTSSDKKNAQPLVGPWLAVAHNGNWHNATSVMVEHLGDVDFKTGMDTEVFLHLVLKKAPTMPQSLEEIAKVVDEAQGMLQGSGSVVILTPLGLLWFRDHSGNHPMVLAKLPNGGHMVASEEPALFVHGVRPSGIQVVEPGEIGYVQDGQVVTRKLQYGEKPLQRCGIELAYFLNIDGWFDGIPPREVRWALGVELARECPIPGVDRILPIPSSGTPAAMGFAAEHEVGMYDPLSLSRNPHIGRNFIEGMGREDKILDKYRIDYRELVGLSAGFIDDSIVRGTTSREIVRMARDAGVQEVHLRSAWPPWQYLCRTGIDTQRFDELALIKHKGLRGFAEHIGADSVGFLSEKGLMKVLAQFGVPGHFCTSCVTGKYLI